MTSSRFLDITRLYLPSLISPIPSVSFSFNAQSSAQKNVAPEIIPTATSSLPKLRAPQCTAFNSTLRPAANHHAPQCMPRFFNHATACTRPHILQRLYSVHITAKTVGAHSHSRARAAPASPHPRVLTPSHHITVPMRRRIREHRNISHSSRFDSDISAHW